MNWVQYCINTQRVGTHLRIVEIGGRNANYGTVRSLWPHAFSYTAVDLHEGEGVDWVGDFVDYSPEGPVDLVVATEVFEHCEHWRTLIQHSSQILGHQGAMLITAASIDRAPHSALDGSRPLPKGEYYQNIDPMDLFDGLFPYFRRIEIEYGPGERLGLVDPDRVGAIGDVYALARRP